MGDLLEMLTIEDLNGNERELAELVGLEGFKQLVRHYGGTSWLYVPKADTITIPVRNTLIRREFNGDNVPELATKWNLTERYIQEIVKEEAKALRQKPLDGQISLFG